MDSWLLRQTCAMDGHREQRNIPNSVLLRFRCRHGRIIGMDSERATIELSMQCRHRLVFESDLNECAITWYPRETCKVVALLVQWPG